MSYWISKHSVVAITRTFGNSAVANKTGVKHVALCPWFAETGIIDDTTRKTVMERSPLKFVPVERVGEALQLAVEEQRWVSTDHSWDLRYSPRTGSLICVLPNTPLVYYPDTLMVQGLVVFLLSKVAGIFGAERVRPGLQSLLVLVILLLYTVLCHLLLNYLGF